MVVRDENSSQVVRKSTCRSTMESTTTSPSTSRSGVNVEVNVDELGPGSSPFREA
jgi:hypothetical protein